MRNCQRRNQFPGQRTAYSAQLQPEEANNNDPAISALLPLFPDQGKSAAMIHHSMDVFKDCVNRVNPGQTPVIAMDQPLFTLAKQIQWNFPKKYGKDKFVIMFRGLHVEMAFLKALGGWLEGSGWTSALSEANVTATGRADPFLKAAMVTRTRRAHQETAGSIYILFIRAYDNNKKDEEPGSVRSFNDWCLSKVATVPQFHFWYLILRLKLLLLTFVRYFREVNFQLYIDVVTQTVPWLLHWTIPTMPDGFQFTCGSCVHFKTMQKMSLRSSIRESLWSESLHDASQESLSTRPMSKIILW